MQDLTPAHVFLSQAFEPHRDDVRQAIRQGREQKRQPSFQTVRSVPKREVVLDLDSDVPEMSSSSDEEMPDLQELLAKAASSPPPPPDKPPKARAKKEPKAKVKGRTVVSDDDDDSPMDEVNLSRCHRPVRSLMDMGQDTDLHSTMKGIRGKRQAQKAKGPAPAEKREPGMSAEMVDHWRRGDDNMESSTKMVALIEYLQKWDASGDKTIVFSQCAFVPQQITYIRALG